MFKEPMSKETSGTVMAISKNKAALAVSNENGWTVVELIGSEGEIAVGDIVSGDWGKHGGQDLILNRRKFSAYFQGIGSKRWALGLVNRWGC
jgi:hypothetical protein